MADQWCRSRDADHPRAGFFAGVGTAVRRSRIVFAGPRMQSELAGCSHAPPNVPSIAPGLLFRERFKGTTQAILFDRPVRRGGTPAAVSPMLIVTGNARIPPRSPWPSRFARSSRSWRWRRRPLRLHASRGFSGVPANQSIDQGFLGNCHSQKRYSRPLVRRSMRRHATKMTRARHDRARPLKPWQRPAHAQSGAEWYPPFAVLKAVIRDHFCWSCGRRLRECRTAKDKREAQGN